MPPNRADHFAGMRAESPIVEPDPNAPSCSPQLIAFLREKFAQRLTTFPPATSLDSALVVSHDAARRNGWEEVFTFLDALVKGS